MFEKLQTKIVQWWVYREVSTGKWCYSNQHPGIKQAGLHGPMDFAAAREMVYVKNKEVET